MDVFSNLSQYRDVMSEVVRYKAVGQFNIKKWLGAAFLLVTFLWLFKEHDSLELRNCVSVSHRLHAVKSGIPTTKVKPLPLQAQANDKLKKRTAEQADI